MHKAVEHPQNHGYGQEFDVVGVPEVRPLGQQEDTDQPDEPATPDRDPYRIQNDARVGQGAGVTHFCMASLAAFSKPKLPGPGHLLGSVLTLQIEYPACPRNLAAFTIANLHHVLMKHESTMHHCR